MHWKQVINKCLISEGNMISIRYHVRKETDVKVTNVVLDKEIKQQKALMLLRKSALARQKENLAERLKVYLIQRCWDQIEKRDLDTPFGLTEESDLYIADRSIKERLWICRFNEYMKYSSRVSWYVSASYLCGHSDGQDWAVKIPGTITDVGEALAWLTPAKVKKAKTVKRQGDVYLIPSRKFNFDALPASHELTSNETGYMLRHNQHPTVILEGFGWTAIRQKQMAVGNKRRGAD